MKLGRKFGVKSAAALTAAVAFASVGASVGHAANTITGSGSTFIKNLFDVCAPLYNDKGTDTVSYAGGGSGAGRTAFTGGTVDFAGTDSTYAVTDTPPADYTYVPVIAGPVAIEYKNTDISGTLKLSAATIAGIFAGTITNWNDAAIAADSGLTIPSRNITVVYRSDSSGTSAGFTSYLNAAAPSVWTKAGSSTFTSSAPNGAPGNGTGKSGSDGVTNYVAQTNGSISYAELSYAKDAAGDQVKVVSVKNASGAYVAPSAASATAALSGIPSANFNNDTGWVAPDFVTTSATAYPITILSFVLAHKNYSSAQLSVKNFIDWTINTCSPANSSSIGYAQLTGSALTFAKARLALVASVGAPVATTTTVPAAPKASVAVNKTIAAKALALAGKLTVSSSSKITLKVTSGTSYAKAYTAYVKGLKKGTAKVLVSVKTGTTTKTATVTVTVS